MPFQQPVHALEVDLQAIACRQFGLEELYGYYARTQEMLTNIIRDEGYLPVSRRLMAPYWQWQAALRECLLHGRAERGRRRRRVEAAVGHAVELETWRSLVVGQGLDAAAAADLMTRLVAAASVDSPPDGRAGGGRGTRSARRARAPRT